MPRIDEWEMSALFGAIRVRKCRKVPVNDLMKYGAGHAIAAIQCIQAHLKCSIASRGNALTMNNRNADKGFQAVVSPVIDGFARLHNLTV